MSVDVDYDKWGGLVARFQFAEFMALETIGSGLYAIDFGPVELPLLVRHRQSPVTMYAFHSATSRKVSLPYFQGGEVSDKRLNLVRFGDPSL